MTLRCIVIAMFIGSMTVGLTVQADPWKDESGNGSHKNKQYQKKQKKKHKYKGEHGREYESRSEHQGPPPWAPAHGLRRKHHQNAEHAEIVVSTPVGEENHYIEHSTPQAEFELVSQKIGILTGTCNREEVGAVMGAIVGGIIGNKTTSSKNRTVGTLAGAVIGVVLGKEIGRSMDNADAQCTSQVLERARDGQAVAWNNPESGQHYSVTPYKTYQEKGGRYCREYKATIKEGSSYQSYNETACRTESGMWKKQ